MPTPAKPLAPWVIRAQAGQLTSRPRGVVAPPSWVTHVSRTPLLDRITDYAEQKEAARA